MNRYEKLRKISLSEGTLSQDQIWDIVTNNHHNLLNLCSQAYEVRRKAFSNSVKIHILDNVKSGNCHEDCRYCGQSKSAETDTPAEHDYKSSAAILDGAREAHAAGSYRYCMAFSGTRQPKQRLADIAHTVREIKRRYPIQVCVSAGFLDDDDAALLVEAGVNRYNHNINTSHGYYEKICGSHRYEDRLKTIETAKRHGLELCCGVIVGMGESTDDIMDMFQQLKAIQPASIPINFFVPVEGHRIPEVTALTPAFCLRMLCAFRLAFPETDIRIAAGREYHLRTLQPLCLYPVSSIFANGYLTIGGESLAQTKQMILDGGFTIDAGSEIPIEK